MYNACSKSRPLNKAIENGIAIRVYGNMATLFYLMNCATFVWIVE